MGDEGTPEIVYKDASGYYYVTFHGWAPQQVFQFFLRVVLNF